MTYKVDFYWIKNREGALVIEFSIVISGFCRALDAMIPVIQTLG